jgi:iron complex transport system substrate-binding protein
LMRIASLLPSATEIICALGLGEHLIGVSHECDHPPGVVASLPRLTKSAIPDGLSAAEIDREVSNCVRHGKSLYLLDEERLMMLKPDFLITQELCDVCAVSYQDVCSIAARLPGSPQVLSLAPPDLNGMFDDIACIAAAMDVAEQGEALVAGLRARLAAVGELVKDRPRPRAFALEWLDPPFAAGHWLPEMIAWAGGEEIIGRTGKKSFRTTWEAIIAAQPEVILLIPCGYTKEAAEQEWLALPKPAGWETLPAVQQGCVYALDANSYCSRPAPRLVDGVEQLACLLHPASALA